MTFPDDPLLLEVQMALGADINGDPSLWSWTDISTYVRIADGARVRVNRGRRNDSGSTTPATCEFELNNHDGRFCVENPTGPYYPQLGVNTPVKVRVSSDSGGTWSPRFAGYFRSLPISWRGPAGSDSWVSVTAESILGRLDEESPRSPLARSAPALLSAGRCIEYWPMEDSQAATECTSAFSGGLPMTVSGSLDTGRSSPPPGSKATPMSDYEFMAARPPSATGVVRPYTDSGEWTVFGTFRFESEAAFSMVLMDCDINRGEASTDPDQVRLVVTDTGFTMQAYREDDTLLGSVATGIIANRPPGDGEWHAIAVRAAQSGADISFRIRYEGLTTTLTLTTKTLGTVRRVSFPSATITTAPKSLSVGHVAVYDDDLATFYVDRYAQAMLAYVGERVDTRVNRLDTESGLMYQVTTEVFSANMLEYLGEQPHANSIGIIQDAAETDGGIVYEPRDFGDGSLRYRARNWVNGAVAGSYGAPLTLTQDDFSFLGHTLDGHYQSTRVIVSGAGSSAVASAATFQNETAVSVNLAYPHRLPDMAGWAVFQGTRPDPRFPNIQVKLHATPGLVDDWGEMDPGEHVQLSEPPDGIPDVIDQILEGYSESIGPREWTVDLYCSPASRYRIAKLDHTTYGRMDTASSRLVNALTSSATTFDVETVEGPEWTTTAGFDVAVGGERMTASAITGSFNDSFTRTTANGWGTSTSGHVWSTNGGAASDYSTNGTRGIISLGAVNAFRSTYISTLPAVNLDRTFITRIPVLATGAGILVRHLARWDVAANTYYAAGLQVETDQTVTAQLTLVIAGTTTTLASRNVPSLTHGTTTDFRIRFRLNGPRLFMKVWSGATEPVQWTLSTYDAQLTAPGVWGCRARLNPSNTNTLPVSIQFDTDATAHPQKFTVARSVNGVVKAHSANAAVGLFQPNYLGL